MELHYHTGGQRTQRINILKLLRFLKNKEQYKKHKNLYIIYHPARAELYNF